MFDSLLSGEFSAYIFEVESGYCNPSASKNLKTKPESQSIKRRADLRTRFWPRIRIDEIFSIELEESNVFLNFAQQN